MGVTLHVVIFYLFVFNYGTKSCKVKQMDHFDATNYCTAMLWFLDKWEFGPFLKICTLFYWWDNERKEAKKEDRIQ